MSHSKNWILLVEDEEALGQGLEFNFTQAGFKVTWIADGVKAMNFIQKECEHLAVIVLDLMLPGLDGYSILQRTRAFAERIPILVLSAKSLDKEKALAFEKGADDYVTKPFSLAELLLRVKRLAKQSQWYHASLNPQQAHPFFGPLCFDASRFLLYSPTDTSVQHKLSPTEAMLIRVLLAQPENHVITRQELLKKVWQYVEHMETRTVDVFIGKLRKYIEKNLNKPEYLISVRGVGYQYVPHPNPSP